MRKNRYVHRAKISESKFRQFLRCFALDMEATKIARLARLNRNTVNRLGRAVRERIAEACDEEQRESEPAGHEAPAPRAIRILRTRIGRRGGWRNVSAHLCPGDRVQVEVEETAAGLPPAASNRLVRKPDRDPWPGEDGIGSPDGVSPLRTLDIFWGQAMLRLAKFKGVSRRTYHLHLKECQFRFNHRREDLYALLLRLIRNRPLF